MRKEYSEIKKIAEKLGCDEIFSWSKLNCYKNDSYEYMLKYILKIPEDRNDSIYSAMGSLAHSVLEDYYNNEITREEMSETFEDKLFEYTVGGLKYDRTDEDKNKKIGNKYEECLRHFFINHIKINHKPKLEMFIPIKIDNVMLQGYIDFIHSEIRNNIKVMVVTDFKTSSIYKGKKLDKEKDQLLIYGLGIHQKLNIPLEQIIVRWVFLKYVNIDCLQANGNWKVRTIERNDIGNSLQSSAKMWLKKSELKLDEYDIENQLQKMIDTNDIKHLPEDVQDKFIIRDCYVEVPLNEETISELKANIIMTVKEIKEKEKEYSKTKDYKVWWQDVTNESGYYMANLSGFSAAIHKPYKEYLDNLELFKDGGKKDSEEENDMSWLTGLLDD